MKPIADNTKECAQLHRILQEAFRHMRYASNSATAEVGCFGASGSLPGTKTKMLFALQTAWPFIHGSGDETLKKEASAVMRNNSEWKDFWDQALKPKDSPFEQQQT